MKKFLTYLKSSSAEMKNVRWPGRRETVILTIVVVVVSFVIAYYLGLFDYIFTTALKFVL